MVSSHYDAWRVMFSFLIAALSAFVAFEAADHTHYSSRSSLWIFIGGVTLGMGIWSMHFIGMLAWRPPFRVFYGLKQTLLSVLISITASWLAMLWTAREREQYTWRSRVPAAFLVGAGICGMHYVGMSAIHFSKPVIWHPVWIVLSFVIAVVASWCALWLFRQTKGDDFGVWRQLLAALVLGGAICGMHYTGMHGFSLSTGTIAIETQLSFPGIVLERIGVTNALALTVFLLIFSYRDKEHWLRMASEARFAAQEASRKAEQLAAAGRIAASIAHEINNPLEVVTNLLYMLEMSDLGEAEREYLLTAQSELARISEITTHTLRFYRQSNGPSPTSIPDLFGSALRLFRPRIQDLSIVVETSWPDDLPPITCREGEIRQVIANLIGNAIDAMPHGGTLRLSIEPSDAGLSIHVADTGPGISPELQRKILEPFFTTKGVGGTGLGLSISTEIAARHGGTLTFTSSTDPENSGTTFHLFLPFNQPEPTPEEEPTALSKASGAERQNRLRGWRFFGMCTRLREKSYGVGPEAPAPPHSFCAVGTEDSPRSGRQPRRRFCL